MGRLTGAYCACLCAVAFLQLWGVTAEVHLRKCAMLHGVAGDTKRALQEVYINQHPVDCSKAQFLVCNFTPPWGLGQLGSKLPFLAGCLGRAYGMKRVAIIGEATQENMGVGNVSVQLAPFEPWTKCSLRDVRDRDPGAVKVHDWLHFPKHQEGTPSDAPYNWDVDTPKQFLRRRSASKRKSWWRMVLLTYMMRPTAETKDCLARLKDIIQWEDGQMHTMHIRRGDKVGSEAYYFPFIFYAEALRQMVPYAPQSPPLRVYIATDSKESVAMELQPFTFIKAQFFPDEFWENYQGTVDQHDMLGALEILLVAEGKTFTGAGSSHFGMASVFLSLGRNHMCINATSLDYWFGINWPALDSDYNAWPNKIDRNAIAFDYYDRSALRFHEALTHVDVKLWWGHALDLVGDHAGESYQPENMWIWEDLYKWSKWGTGQAVTCMCDVETGVRDFDDDGDDGADDGDDDDGGAVHEHHRSRRAKNGGQKHNKNGSQKE